MPGDDFHQRPFDDGTLTKLRIFEFYAREWLPVFLANQRPRFVEIHLFDFFAGPGMDSTGELGSPLRLLRQLRDYRDLPGWSRVRIVVHFFDESPEKIRDLEQSITAQGLRLSEVTFDIQPLPFGQALPACERILSDPQTAKLVFIDQFGVDHVTAPVFRQLVGFPTCDFLFFLSSSTLHRFRDRPAIMQKIARPDDYSHVHCTGRPSITTAVCFPPDRGISWLLSPLKKDQIFMG